MVELNFKNTKRKNKKVEIDFTSIFDGYEEDNRWNNFTPILFAMMGIGAVILIFLLIVTTLVISIENSFLRFDYNNLEITGEGFEQTFSANKDFPKLGITTTEDIDKYHKAIIKKAEETKPHFDSMKFIIPDVKYSQAILVVNDRVKQKLPMNDKYFNISSVVETDDVVIKVEYHFSELRVQTQFINEVGIDRYVLTKGNLKVS